jgi:hypothetical protein
MAEARSNVRAVLNLVVTVAVAGLLVGMATAARLALASVLGALSPFMIYVAALLAAGLVRGPLCGGLVMLAGGVLGLRLFLAPHGATAHGSVAALMIFWAVSAGVLLTANELRVQLGAAMARLSAALERRRAA